MNPTDLLIDGLSDIVRRLLDTNPKYVEQKLDVEGIQNDFMRHYPMFEHDEIVKWFIPEIIGVEYYKKIIESE